MLQFAGEHLDAKDKGFLGTGKSDPYIILSLPNRTGPAFSTSFATVSHALLSPTLNQQAWVSNQES